ncbi:hypothetical protein V2G26_008183 [Clonostachys chloroleuca]
MASASAARISSLHRRFLPFIIYRRPSLSLQSATASTSSPLPSKKKKKKKKQVHRHTQFGCPSPPNANRPSSIVNKPPSPTTHIQQEQTLPSTKQHTISPVSERSPLLQPALPSNLIPPSDTLSSPPACLCFTRPSYHPRRTAQVINFSRSGLSVSTYPFSLTHHLGNLPP